MAQFRMYFLDQGGNVRGQAEFLAKDDKSAILVAKSMKVDGIAKGFSLWQEDRRVSLERDQDVRRCGRCPLCADSGRNRLACYP